MISKTPNSVVENTKLHINTLKDAGRNKEITKIISIAFKSLETCAGKDDINELVKSFDILIKKVNDGKGGIQLSSTKK